MKETVEKSVDTQQVENKNNTNPEKLTSKGEERYENISQTINDKKAKFSGWVKNGAAKFGRIFKTGAVGILSAPEAAVHGTKVAGQAIGQEAGYIKDAAKEGYNYVEGKVVSGVKSVGEDLTNLDNYVGDKAEQFDKWIGEKSTSVYECTAKKYKEFQNFKEIKKEKMKKSLQNKIATTEAVGSLLIDKTVGGYNATINVIKNNYESTIDYSKDAIETATLRSWYARDAFNRKLNSVKQSILEKKAEIQAEKLQKTLAKLSQFRQVEGFENKLAA